MLENENMNEAESQPSCLGAVSGSYVVFENSHPDYDLEICEFPWDN